jgi:hypothetical protein
MDGLQSAQKNKDAGVVVVGATNRVCKFIFLWNPYAKIDLQPHDLDDAVLRRLATRMLVDLPGTKERQRTSCIFITCSQLM